MRVTEGGLSKSDIIAKMRYALESTEFKPPLHTSKFRLIHCGMDTIELFNYLLDIWCFEDYMVELNGGWFV